MIVQLIISSSIWQLIHYIKLKYALWIELEKNMEV